MKKIIAIFFTVFLNLAFISCTPNAIQDDSTKATDCCGDEGPILPPPPVPPKPGK